MSDAKGASVMRKSGGLAIPLTLIVIYYGFWITLGVAALVAVRSFREDVSRSVQEQARVQQQLRYW